MAVVYFDLYKYTWQIIIDLPLEIVNLQRLQIQREIKKEKVIRAKNNRYSVFKQK